jgi:hypothetical protein
MFSSEHMKERYVYVFEYLGIGGRITFRWILKAQGQQFVAMRRDQC